MRTQLALIMPPGMAARAIRGILLIAQGVAEHDDCKKGWVPAFVHC